MTIKLQDLYKGRIFVLALAAASILTPFRAATSLAQSLTFRDDGPDSVAGGDDGAPLAAVNPGLPDLPPVSPIAASAGPDGDSQATAPAQDSSAGDQRQLSVNPLTGMVSASGASYTPLTGEERWKLYWRMNYLSVGAYFGPFFSALVLDQATTSPYQWGGGFPGYGRRVASRTASAMLQGTLQAPTAYLLHDDVRYISSKQPGFRHRAVHALAYSFLTYNSSGHPTLNVANLGAYYASTAVTTAWLPGHYKVLSYTLSNSSEQIALTLPINLLQEFWPEVRRVVHRH